MQVPPHRFPIAPHEPRIVNVQLVVAASDREQQTVWTETDRLHFAIAQFELWRGARARSGEKTVQRDLLQRALPIFSADIVQPQKMRAVVGGGA